MRILLVLSSTWVGIKPPRCSVVSMFFIKPCPGTAGPHNGDDYVCQKEGSGTQMIMTRTRIKISDRYSCH